MNYFAHLQQPITEGLLKSEFRRLAKKLHSDTGGSDEQFRILKAEYDDVIAHGFVIAAIEEAKTTIEGRMLTTLGLGLKTNGSECVDCSGRGFHKWHEARERCRRCRFGSIPYCGLCHRIITKWRRVGFLIPDEPVPCCRGAQVKLTRCDNQQCEGGLVKGRAKYSVCTTCDGAGEIPVFNPVIIKGTLAGGRSASS